MNTYRFVYWFNSCTTEWYVKAGSKEEAVEKFRDLKGNSTIINIEECV